MTKTTADSGHGGRLRRAVGLWLGIASLASAQAPVATDSIARGVQWARYELPGPVSAHVVTVDLREPSVRLQAFQLPGLVRTSAQARALADSGHQVLAAINADFFSFQTGWPVGNTVIDGTLVLGLPSKRSHLVISGRAKPFIERLTFLGVVMTARGHAITLGAVNNGSPSAQARMYTHWYGKDTGSDTLGVKILLLEAAARAGLSDTTFYVVTGRVIRGRAPIPADGAVLAVPDEILEQTGGGFLVGDTLAVVADVVPFVPDVRQTLGGAGRILINGVCDTVDNHAREDLSLKFQSDRHPRTFVGFDRDTTLVYLCVVDGRQDHSRGMTFGEMAEFLRALGAWNAVNLDGGGSTTMIVGGSIVNRPSDVTGERPVANILAVVRHGQGSQ